MVDRIDVGWSVVCRNYSHFRDTNKLGFSPRMEVMPSEFLRLGLIKFNSGTGAIEIKNYLNSDFIVYYG